jgi:hypothetical protein
VSHYRRYEPIARRITREPTHIESALNDTLSKISVMMNMPVPKVSDTIYEYRDLKKTGYRNKKHEHEIKDERTLLQVA